MSPQRAAIVFSGGGARGAYEAGVVRYLREELPRLTGGHVRFDIVCGTSVGALTACFLAATMDTPQSQGEVLANMWKSLTLDKVYQMEGQDLWTITRRIWRAATTEPKRPEGWRLHDMLHPEPLERIVRTGADWTNISRNLEKGLFTAISVSATSISSGKLVVFVQHREGKIPPWTRDTNIEGRHATLAPEHALASAAIPLLFKSVRIGEEYFCDGSIRQNTPLSPALRLGAEKVLIVSPKFRSSAELPAAPEEPLEYPTTPVLMGRVLNALMLDHTDQDLDRLRRFNTMLDAGQLAFGDDFLERINQAVKELRGQPYRRIRDMVVRPSRDIANIAAAHARRMRVKFEGRPSLSTKLLHRVAQSQLINQADLASYLLFDGPYADDLISLAMEDAHARREELARFFSEDEPATRGGTRRAEDREFRPGPRRKGKGRP